MRESLKHATEWLLRPLQQAARTRGCAIAKCPPIDLHSFPQFFIIASLLNVIRGGRVCFIQVGANDGGDGDPIADFARKYPWHGILIEPQPDVFQELCANYGNAPGQLFFENVGIGPTGSSALTLYRERNDGHVNGRNQRSVSSKVVSVDRSVTAHQLGVSVGELEAVTVPCVTLDSLVMKHRLHTIDILMIDTEGYDATVLSTLDLAHTRPLVIQFEHGHMSVKNLGEAFSLLQSHGYSVMYGGSQADSVAVHSSIRDVIESGT